MDNHNEKQNHSMMWMMLPCLLILVFFVLAGGVSFGSWPLLALVGIMVGAHLWMMFRGHGHGSSDENHSDMTDTKQASPDDASPHVDEKKDHSGHSCCH